MKKRRLDFGNFITHIVLIIFSLFALFPVWWTIIMALSTPGRISLASTEVNLLPQGFTFGNFEQVFRNANFTMWMKNSFIFAGGTTIFALALATVAAYAFSRFNFPGKKAGLIGFIVFMMLPTTAAMLPQYLLWSRLNLINTYHGMILMYTSGTIAFSIWNLKGYFDTVPKSIEEAAIIDGASKAQVFKNIILPLSTPALVTTALFIFMGPWMDFAGAFIFISDQKKYTFAMGLYTWASDPRNVPWPLFAAGSIVVAAPVAVIYMVFQRYLVSGLTVGGVKG
jgi:arabinogalactan oligomer / maltooligosaccharide transport system permease protein